jgi:hypothetical protein
MYIPSFRTKKYTFKTSGAGIEYIAGHEKFNTKVLNLKLIFDTCTYQVYNYHNLLFFI